MKQVTKRELEQFLACRSYYVQNVTWSTPQRYNYIDPKTHEMIAYQYTAYDKNNPAEYVIV